MNRPRYRRRISLAAVIAVGLVFVWFSHSPQSDIRYVGFWRFAHDAETILKLDGNGTGHYLVWQKKKLGTTDAMLFRWSVVDGVITMTPRARPGLDRCLEPAANLIGGLFGRKLKPFLVPISLDKTVADYRQEDYANGLLLIPSR